jgi:hypothetical protein
MAALKSEAPTAEMIPGDSVFEAEALPPHNSVRRFSLSTE